MDLSFIKNDLETKGYCLVPDVLSPDEAQQCANELKNGNKVFQIMTSFRII